MKAHQANVQVELTHTYCLERAAMTLQSVYTRDQTNEMMAHTLAAADRWLAIAAEIRAGEELASYKFNVLKERLEQETM